MAAFPVVFTRALNNDGVDDVNRSSSLPWMLPHGTNTVEKYTQNNCIYPKRLSTDL